MIINDNLDPYTFIKNATFTQLKLKLKLTTCKINSVSNILKTKTTAHEK